MIETHGKFFMSSEQHLHMQENFDHSTTILRLCSFNVQPCYVSDIVEVNEARKQLENLPTNISSTGAAH